MKPINAWRLTYSGVYAFGVGVAIVVRFDGHWAGFAVMAFGSYLLAEVAEASFRTKRAGG